MEPLQDGDPRGIAAYRIDARLASGGMGIVYLGVSPGGRQVAVKLIRPEFASDPEFRERFRREVEASRKVGGFHTAAVVDADADADPPWMITQYIAGPSLHDQVRQHGPLDQAAVLRLASALAEGLSAIHAAGLIHRDLKPRNVIMAADGPRIIDFGIAKPAGATTDPGLTATDKVIGTPEFMSPEHFDGGLVSPASDIFALGSVLAFAATGRPPFAGGSLPATGYAIVKKAPDLRVLPPGLREVVAACLAKDPADRPTPEALLSLIARTGSSLGPLPLAAAGESVAAATLPWPDGEDADQTTITRPVLGRLLRQDRAPARRAPLPRVRIPDPLPPQPQVRPAGQRWRLITASRDGRWVAAANGDGVISVWLAGPGTPVRSWAAGARVLAMATGPDDLLVAAGDDGQVRAWDVATGNACQYLDGYLPGITGRAVQIGALSLDRTGAWLAASTRGKLLVWDVADPREPLPIAELPGTAEVTALAFDDSGWLLAAGDTDGKVHLWDLREPWDTAPVDPPATLADAASSGAVLALGWDDASRRWLSVGADSPPGATAVPATPLQAAAYSLPGGLAAIIDADRRIHLVGLTGSVGLVGLTGSVGGRTLGGTDLVITGVAFAGEGTLAVGASDGALRLWDTRLRTMRTVGIAGSPVTAMAASPDGTRLIVTDRRPRMTAHALGSGPPGGQWSADCRDLVAAVSVSPDGSRLLTAGDGVRVWDAGNGTELRRLPVRAVAAGTDRVRAAACDPAGRVAAAWSSGIVSVWNGTRLLWELPGHKGDATAVAFGPVPGHLVTAGDDLVIRLWDLGSGRQAASYRRLGYRVTALAARPGPARAMIVAGCADGTIRLIEPTGQRSARVDWADAPVLAGHTHEITAMSFDASGQWLATASRDGTAWVWDLSSRRAACVLLPDPSSPGAGAEGSAGWAAAVASPDGTWHGLGETDGRIWQAAGLECLPLPAPTAVLPFPPSLWRQSDG
ncbi:MAG TPA: protein kinase [Trebonia sp.]|nr:protein kinase [Trebonia sp.]